MEKYIRKHYIMCSVLFYFSSAIIVGAVIVGVPPLSNAVLKLLDGIPFALDGATIWDMMRIRHGIKKVQFGMLNPETKTYEGKYVFQGRRYTLHSLAEYERATDAAYYTKKYALECHYIDKNAYEQYQEELAEVLEALEKKFEDECLERQEVVERTVEDEHVVREQISMEEALYVQYQDEITEQEETLKRSYIQDIDGYEAAYTKLKKEHDAYRDDLAPVFMVAKEDVLKILQPFSKKMMGAKKFLFKLVEEFCQKRNRPKSFLLHWSTIADGQEFVIFNKTMTSCKILDEFSTDLTNFLKDVIDSCPRGWQQFLELSKPKK